MNRNIHIVGTIAEFPDFAKAKDGDSKIFSVYPDGKSEGNTVKVETTAPNVFFSKMNRGDKIEVIGSAYTKKENIDGKTVFTRIVRAGTLSRDMKA